MSLAALRRTRALLRNRNARLIALGISVAYVLLSMLIGQMLTFPGFSGSSLVTVQWNGNPWWDFPELFVFSSGVALDLLLFPTVTMVLVSAGVGIGATAAIFSTVPWLRRRASGAGREAATSSAAGASAAITGLATMGACCCTACAGAAGVAVVAAASGADIGLLLRETWYLDVFQLVVVGTALLAQERSLRMAAAACRTPPFVDRSFVLGTLLRIALLIAGITWSLAMFVEWAEVPPLSASPVLWYHWIVEHQVLSLVAVAAGMFPKEIAGGIRKHVTSPQGWVLRGLLLAGGLTWGLWVPPALTAAGLGGFVNELLGVLGRSVSWGAIAPDVALGPALAFHWAFQHLLLAAFAIAVALRPQLAMAPLLKTVEGAADGGATAGPSAAT